jgi:hypothetical protein
MKNGKKCQLTEADSEALPVEFSTPWKAVHGVEFLICRRRPHRRDQPVERLPVLFAPRVLGVDLSGGTVLPRPHLSKGRLDGLKVGLPHD